MSGNYNKNVEIQKQLNGQAINEQKESKFNNLQQDLDAYEKQRLGLNFQEEKKAKQSSNRRRGRPSRKMMQQAGNQLSNMRIRKQRKLEVIEVYQNAQNKVRQNLTNYFTPFEKPKLNLNEVQTIRLLKDARDHSKNMREAARAVGIRNERNLFKYGVNEQITYIINYIENGKIPKWMKQHFQQLLQKDFTKIDNLQAHSQNI